MDSSVKALTVYSEGAGDPDILLRMANPLSPKSLFARRENDRKPRQVMASSSNPFDSGSSVHTRENTDRQTDRQKGRQTVTEEKQT